MHIPLCYLATPYSHPMPKVRKQRYRSASDLAFKFYKLGLFVYSPIAHSHGMPRDAQWNEDAAKYTRYEYWRPFDERMISVCDAIIFDRRNPAAWGVSVGMAGELRYAKDKPAFDIRDNQLRGTAFTVLRHFNGDYETGAIAGYLDSVGR